MSKGDSRRPARVSSRKFLDNFEYAFRREKKNDAVMKHKKKEKDDGL